MRREFSAGGIVYRRFHVPCSMFQVKWLIVQHSQHKGWVFPKGLIGDTKDGETKEETAIREVREEGGVKARIIAEIKPPITYWYSFEGEKIFKTVYFFLMEYLSGDIADHDQEVSEAKWLTEKQVRKTLTYENDKRAFEKALKIFKKKVSVA